VTISSLWLGNFRCFEKIDVDFDPMGLTVLRGPNGSGKTSVLEAVGWLSTMRSIRGAAREILVRSGEQSSILRAEVSSPGRSSVDEPSALDERSVLIEAEIRSDRPGRVQVDRHQVRRRAELAQTLQVSVFSPADRRLVEGGPSHRRGYLDDVLAERHPRLEALVDEVGRVLRQRAALLQQAGPRPDESAASSLEIWDMRLATSGSELVTAREALVAELEPLVASAYSRLAAAGSRIRLSYRRSWEGDLLDALQAHRVVDLRRRQTSVGPHRDELEIHLDRTPARTHASQGEQRCIALALRLGTHELRRNAAPEPPVLLLDDVFSELDPRRSDALVELLPRGQVLLTTAVDPPVGVSADRVVELRSGQLVAQSSSSR
jgi:DNA replication and repair protein RecF